MLRFIALLFINLGSIAVFSSGLYSEKSGRPNLILTDRAFENKTLWNSGSCRKGSWDITPPLPLPILVGISLALAAEQRNKRTRFQGCMSLDYSATRIKDPGDERETRSRIYLVEPALQDPIPKRVRSSQTPNCHYSTPPLILMRENYLHID